MNRGCSETTGRAGEQLGFALKSGQAVAIGAEYRGKDLERCVTLQLRVASAVDFAHAAGPQRSDDFVRAESRA